jgi:RNA recognition motif-containing protein
MDNTIQLKCRKCGGKHLTIKCQQNKENNTDKQIKPTIIEENKKLLPANIEENKFNKQYYNKTTYKVKISNLPNDIDYDELHELIKDWGIIIKIILKSYTDTTFAIIEFKNKIEQEYFIEALNNTVFDHNIINVIKLEY